MPQAPNVYTLDAYELLPGFTIRIAKALTGAKRALRVGSTIWISPAMSQLIGDRDKRARRRVMASIDVLVVAGTLGQAIQEAF